MTKRLNAMLAPTRAMPMIRARTRFLRTLPRAMLAFRSAAGLALHSQFFLSSHVSNPGKVTSNIHRIGRCICMPGVVFLALDDAMSNLHRRDDDRRNAATRLSPMTREIKIPYHAVESRPVFAKLVGRHFP